MNDVEINDIDGIAASASQLDKLKNLLIEFGLPYKEEKFTTETTNLTLEVGGHNSNDKVDGYDGFYSSFSFDAEGSFIKVNIGE